ncbi:MAG: hypothetical protein CM15mP63_3210 [Gammaproteobacteria bacterium]|nr:MAG: hypothetical protein CM15mP63_3210 [Gammaproteobacteria bacterium]
MVYLSYHYKREFVNIVKPLLPNVDYCSIRFVSKYSNIINATRGY